LQTYSQNTEAAFQKNPEKKMTTLPKKILSEKVMQRAQESKGFFFPSKPLNID
jgi:hypothetical protein